MTQKIFGAREVDYGNYLQRLQGPAAQEETAAETTAVLMAVEASTEAPAEEKAAVAFNAACEAAGYAVVSVEVGSYVYSKAA